MNAPQSWGRVEAIRTWLQSELGDGANICHQKSVDPCRGSSEAHRFTVSVFASQHVDLLLMRKLKGKIVGTYCDLFITQVEPVTEVKSQGRIARRDFIIHIKEATR